MLDKQAVAQELADMAAIYEAKRKLVLHSHKATNEKAPKCRCGMAMVRRFETGYYYCPFCMLTEETLQTQKARKKKSE